MIAAVLRHVGRRLAAGVLVLWGAATLTFVALHLVPGDQADAILGPSLTATPQLRAQVIADYGLDRPVVVQYLDYLGSLLTGDLGRSYQRDMPVERLLADQVLPTMQLAVSAALAGLALAMIAVVVTAASGRVGRTAATVLDLVVASVPNFWLGLVLLTLFSFRFPIFPSIGASGGLGLVLPTLTLALPLGATLAQVMRQELERADRAPFALSVRARGAGELRLVLAHTLRHAITPAVTLSAWIVGSLIGGTVLVENIFARPGIGRLLVGAVVSKDIPVVTTVVLLSAVTFVLINTVVDLLYPVIDPRLRAERAR
ncbi:MULTISPECIES: ABC transporter permease [Protofrankia]|uniref:ABC-type transporter, integral membrane subunit n=1 Tax=Candidatus Protofrankia datiscae TaxID=2716812 RepID=F8B1G3_9ACTN|nr:MULTISPECIES: ABC transporter permease [Protofrankia]AEH09838.1 ABC-type transporter, integral membrane subunit [Candidatus Protofrankia datiscae]